MIKVLLLIILLSPILEAKEFLIKTFETDTKEIALTFDDGPNKELHHKILNTLDFFQIKASFFYLAANLRVYSDLGKKALAQGHSIGNHSYSHTDLTSLSKKEIQEEIKESQKVFFDTLGTYPRYFRPPYGSIKKSHYKLLKPHFTHVVMWTLDPRDWTKENTTNYIVDNIAPGSIVLLHENENTLEDLPGLIIKLKKQGYTFITIDEALSR